MADPWLSIIGIGEDGPDGLTPASRAALGDAEIVFGGPRHLALAGVGARGRAWPVPFDPAPVLACRGRRVAVLASGDPFWHGAGGSLAAHLAPGDWRAFPVAGTFSLAAARLGWRIEETACLGLHAAPFGRLIAHLAPGARILCLMRDGAAVADLARWLAARGWGQTRLWVMEALGGPRERVRQATADAFAPDCVAAPVTVALIAAGGHALPCSPGLPDTSYAHDGQITKAPVRALTLAALAPRRGELLWDLGAGSGSVSVEWCLAGGRALAIEARPDRAANIRVNAETFGQQGRLSVIEGRVPAALTGLPVADAVFIGGGLTEAVFAALWPRLRPGTRLVVNAVTLETEALLAALHASHGGALMRIELARAAPLGGLRGWQAARPVVQWSVVA